MMGVVTVVGGEVQRSSPYFIYERTSGRGRGRIQGSDGCKSKGFEIQALEKISKSEVVDCGFDSAKITYCGVQWHATAMFGFKNFREVLHITRKIDTVQTTIINHCT